MRQAMWGLIPAAGLGSRIQPLAFSKELLPSGSQFAGATERPRAVSEYLIERMVLGGATKICFVIAPGKSDILQYFGGEMGGTPVCYAVQPQPEGLCDAVFRAAPLVGPDEPVVLGLPDTVWFPADALARVPATGLSLLLFPVERPELFDAVLLEGDDRVREIHVKRPGTPSSWIWGAMKLSGATYHELHALWHARGRRDEFLGTLINAWLAGSGSAVGIRAGRAYVDVGTLHGYREATALLLQPDAGGGSTSPPTEVPA
jgi:dTDP-glucose pyrophosphorylase